MAKWSMSDEVVGERIGVSMHGEGVYACNDIHSHCFHKIACLPFSALLPVHKLTFAQAGLLTLVCVV